MAASGLSDLNTVESFHRSLSPIFLGNDKNCAQDDDSHSCYRILSFAQNLRKDGRSNENYQPQIFELNQKHAASHLAIDSLLFIEAKISGTPLCLLYIQATHERSLLGFNGFTD